MPLLFIGGTFALILIYTIVQQKPKRDNVAICKNRLEEEFKKHTFNTEKSIEYKVPLHETDIFIDKTNEKIAVCEYSKNDITIINFSSILDCEIVEDNIVIKRDLGRAIVGGAVAGGAGAVVGAITAKEKKIVKSLKLKLITNDTLNAVRVIDLLTIQVNTNSKIYKKAIEFASKTNSTLLSIAKANA